MLSSVGILGRNREVNQAVGSLFVKIMRHDFWRMDYITRLVFEYMFNKCPLNSTIVD
jgi:hypothetical protein